MPLRRKLKLVLAGLFFFSVVPAGNANSQPIGHVWIVTITRDGTIFPQRVTLGWEHHDRILWISDFPLDREIRFDEPSPFGKNSATYGLAADKSCDPGPITNMAEHTYTYHAVPTGGVRTGATGDGVIIIIK
jgi:hypothetical protein